MGTSAAKGGSKVLGGTVARIALQIASVSVLAHLLSPDDYGLVAIVLAVVGFGEVFRDFGLSTAAVQAPTLTTEQRDKLFWLNTAIGGVLTLLCLLAAPLVAAAFGHPELTAITRALCLTFLLNGAIAQYRASLNRSMRFGRLVIADLSSQVFGVCCAIVLAVLGAGYWALVGQQLATAAATLVMSVSLAGWLPSRPRRNVDVRPMVTFGLGMVATQFVGYVGGNIDTLTIGLRLTPGELGFYNRGYQLLMRPLSQVRSPSTSVALPVLARLRHDPVKTDDFLATGQLALGYGLVLGTVWSAGSAVPIVDVFLGDRWQPVAAIYVLLAIGGSFETLAYVGNWVYISRALTAQLFRFSLVSLAVKTSSILVGSIWGINGVAAGVAVAPMIMWPISLWWLSRLTPMPLATLYQGAVRIIVVATCVGLASWGAVQLAASIRWGSWSQLGVSAAASTLALGLLYILPPVRRDLTILFSLARKAVKRDGRG